MKKRLALFKVKEEKFDQWKQWCDLLMTTRKKEALESLMYENVSEEFCFGFKLGNNNYIVGGVNFDDPQKEAKLDLAINREHKRQKEECLEYICELDPMYHLTG